MCPHAQHVPSPPLEIVPCWSRSWISTFLSFSHSDHSSLIKPKFDRFKRPIIALEFHFSCQSSPPILDCFRCACVAFDILNSSLTFCRLDIFYNLFKVTSIKKCAKSLLYSFLVDHPLFNPNFGSRQAWKLLLSAFRLVLLNAKSRSFLLRYLFSVGVFIRLLQASCLIQIAWKQAACLEKTWEHPL